MPAPLRPSKATISCSRTSNDDIAQDVALAVERIDVDRASAAACALAALARALRCDVRCARPDIDVLHALGMTRASSTVPSSSTLPSFMTVTWSASRNTRSMSCSTSSTGTSAEMLLDQRADALAFGRGEACKRLVQQQQARPGCERQPHVEQPLAAIGQRAGLGLLDAGEAQIADQGRRSPLRSVRWRAHSSTDRTGADAVPARRGGCSPRSARSETDW